MDELQGGVNRENIGLSEVRKLGNDVIHINNSQMLFSYSKGNIEKNGRKIVLGSLSINIE